MIVTDFANKAAISNGLQGIIIVPKNKPYIRAFNEGLWNVGSWNWGNNSVILILDISNTLIIKRMKKAIGDIIPITDCNDFSKIVVKIRPSKNIERN